jgi:hypothetical protein
VCRRVLPPSQAGDVCGDARCRAERGLRQAAERGRRADAEFEERLARYEAGVRRALGDRLPPDAPRLLLTRCDPPLAPLPRSRRFAFLSHLWSVVEGDGEGPAGGAADLDPERYRASLEPSLAPFAAAACSACGGDCCRTAGGDRAFVNREVLDRYLRAHPGAAPEAFVEDYLGRIPDLVCAESCVYHTPRGCALPADMRGLTCNQFYCGPLRELFDHAFREGPGLVALAIRIGRKKEFSSVLLSARGVEALDYPESTE